MFRLIGLTILFLRRRGTRETLIKVWRKIKGTREPDFMLAGDIENKFTEIYYRNTWGDRESASGRGSSLTYTAHLRRELPKLFEQFSIKSIFDAPCGDFNWMKHVLKDNALNYIGGDIVLPLVDSLNANHATGNVAFVHVDLTKNELPSSDLMLCRDCFIHLSYDDTRRILENFLTSDTRYLLTSTQTRSTKEIENKDIITGGFRPIDLFSAPYSFPTDTLFRIQDGLEMDLCLWTREQVAKAVQAFTRIQSESTCSKK